jgi:hypothetical protein
MVDFLIRGIRQLINTDVNKPLPCWFQEERAPKPKITANAAPPPPQHSQSRCYFLAAHMA